MENELAKIQNDAAKKSAVIVTVDPSKIVDSDGNLVDLNSAGKLRRWLRETFGDRLVKVNDNGNIIRFSLRGLDASIKRRGERQRQMYAELDKLLANSIYAGCEPGDAKHPSVERQDIYYAAARIGDDIYGIRFKVDVREGAKNVTYKDHKTVQIKKPPAPCAGLSLTGTADGQDIKKPSSPYGRVSLPGTEDGQTMPVLKIQEVMGVTCNIID